MVVSICVNTFKRPELLKKLLENLFNQNIPQDITIEVIVVENDSVEQSKSVVDFFQLQLRLYPAFILKYFLQPVKNISITRNVAVKESSGEYIFFIDDDEYPDSNWIKNSLDCLMKYDADIVSGRVIPYFSDLTPVWMKKCKHFMKVTTPTGTKPHATRTSNALVKASLLRNFEAPFNPEYGITGGEDTDLFYRLALSGAKFISCEESIVYDFVPLERSSIKWLFFRYYRTGNSYTRRVIEHSKNSLSMSFYLFLKANLYGIISTLLFFVALPIKPIAVSWFLKIASNLGHLAAVFHLHYKEYD